MLKLELLTGIQLKPYKLLWKSLWSGLDMIWYDAMPKGDLLLCRPSSTTWRQIWTGIKPLRPFCATTNFKCVQEMWRRPHYMKFQLRWFTDTFQTVILFWICMLFLTGSWTSSTSRTLSTCFTSWATTYSLAHWFHITVCALFSYASSSTLYPCESVSRSFELA